MTAAKDDDTQIWDWHVEGPFNPHYDVTASSAGLSYWCEIQGPFCGYDAVATQTWAEFFAAGPLAKVEMPSWIEAQVRAYAKARTLT